MVHPLLLMVFTVFPMSPMAPTSLLALLPPTIRQIALLNLALFAGMDRISLERSGSVSSSHLKLLDKSNSREEMSCFSARTLM